MENCTPGFVVRPDGYNGHTVRFDLTPVETKPGWVRLRCIDPGKQWIVLWFTTAEIDWWLANKELQGA